MTKFCEKIIHSLPYTSNKEEVFVYIIFQFTFLCVILLDVSELEEYVVGEMPYYRMMTPIDLCSKLRVTPH